MKQLVFPFIALLGLVSCKSPAEPESVPQENRVYINNISFDIDSVYFSKGAVRASGTLTNIGTQPVAPLFYVSGEFFKRSNFVTSLGESRVAIKEGVQIGKSVKWTLSQKISDPDTIEYTAPALAKLQLYFVE